MNNRDWLKWWIIEIGKILSRKRRCEMCCLALPANFGASVTPFLSLRPQSDLTTSLPTSLHFNFREGCGRNDRSHIPAAKIELFFPPNLPIFPTHLKIPKIAGRALRPPRAVCIIGICPGIFSAKLGSGIWHSSQVNHKMIAASQAGLRGKVKWGVGPCGKYRGVRSAP